MTRLDPHLLKFCLEMQEQLEANKGRGDWKLGLTGRWFDDGVKRNLRDMRFGDEKQQPRAAVDLANFALMFWMAFQNKALPTHSQRAGSDTEEEDDTCEVCDGYGKIEAGEDYMGINGGGIYYEPCSRCKGTGHKPRPVRQKAEVSDTEGAKELAEVVQLLGHIYKRECVSDGHALTATMAFRAFKLARKYVTSLPTTPATSDEGEKPPQRSLEGGKTSEGLPRPGLPQGQRAERICKGHSAGQFYVEFLDPCPKCSGKRPTSNGGE